jgi:hypothetical protein
MTIRVATIDYFSAAVPRIGSAQAQGRAGYRGADLDTRSAPKLSAWAQDGNTEDPSEGKLQEMAADYLRNIASFVFVFASLKRQTRNSRLTHSHKLCRWDDQRYREEALWPLSPGFAST